MGADSIIYIRTDGNYRISVGHLVRCMSICQALLEWKKKVVFLVSDEESKALMEGLLKDAALLEAVKIRILDNACYDCLENELPSLLSLLSVHSNKPLILVDSYYVTPTYLHTLKKVSKVAYIDDLRKFDYPVNLLVNYDLISSSERMQLQQFYSSAEVLLLGAEYTPLRKQFSGYTPVFRENPRHILITCGGSDPYGFCLEITEFLQKTSLNHLHFHVVIGKLFAVEEKQALEALSKSWKNLYLHEGLSDLAPLMKECDLAVSAAGTTLCELCALGIPTVSFTMADNQLDFAKGFAHINTIPYSGDIRHNKGFQVYEQILSFLEEMCQSPERRLTLQNSMQKLIDGRGCERIAKALSNV